jgi:hypothetical protein
MSPYQIFDKLIHEGGAIVSSNDCSPIEIADARATGRFAVDLDGMGFVLRTKEWLYKAQAAVQASVEQAGRSASPAVFDDATEAFAQQLSAGPAVKPGE